jgi:hypothetical protein
MCNRITELEAKLETMHENRKLSEIGHCVVGDVHDLKNNPPSRTN